MVKVVIIYYSRAGNTKSMAIAVAEGVKVEGVEVEVKRVDWASVFDMLQADAIAFGSPCYYGYMNGMLKDLFDRMPIANANFIEKINGKPVPAFVANGESNEAKDALIAIERILFFYCGFKRVAEGIVSKGKASEQKIKECRELGRELVQAALKRTVSLSD